MAVAAMGKPYILDPKRVWAKKIEDPEQLYDTEVPDAVWVAVVGNDMDSVSSSDAQRDAVRFVTEKYGSGSGIDKDDGPYPDTGTLRPAYVGLGLSDERTAMTTVEEYQLIAAQQNMVSNRDRRYVKFYRVRRLGLI